MIQVAFQGERGAFSEDAAYRYFGSDIQPVPCTAFKDVFESVIRGDCSHGVIPIENSFTGSIHQNIDLLLDYHLAVIGEVFLRIHHNLLALQGIPLKSIKKIYSHPQAISQCSRFLDAMPDVDVIPMYDTAGSAKYIREQQKTDSASIASLRAGKDYGLHALKKKIENDPQNYTRFLIMAARPENPGAGGKTSIVFSTKDIPGALFKALSVFALRDINLLKIESRPLRKGPWQYWFYLDFEGSMEEEPCCKAIDHLHEVSSFVKILGSYEKGKVHD